MSAPLAVLNNSAQLCVASISVANPTAAVALVLIMDLETGAELRCSVEKVCKLRA